VFCCVVEFEKVCNSLGVGVGVDEWCLGVVMWLMTITRLYVIVKKANFNISLTPQKLHLFFIFFDKYFLKLAILLFK